MTESTAFKNMINAEVAQYIADKLVIVHPPFPAAEFMQKVVAQLDALELKARISMMANELRATLPADYPTAAAILMQAMCSTPPNAKPHLEGGFSIAPIAQFVEDFGLDHPDVSLDTLPEITKRFTSEFAIRPYLMRYPAKTLARCQQWAVDPNPHVRRMVSEGTRTRLPWGPRLPQFISDPAPVLALLEMLKDDPALYVRKSVANNLNDLTKDHPDLILSVLARWNEGASDERRWIIKHALRTLIKQGHPAALAILGVGDGADLHISRFDIAPTQIRLGEAVKMTAVLENQGDEAVDVVMDYVVHHVKKNGGSSPKVFKWLTRTLQPGQTLTVQKSHGVKPVTTRVYYGGRHVVELQVNGRVLASGAFGLEVE
ncbi:MAG: hypothetical protein BroJett018_39590 [Chloroflexota bacterium]|nr:MAG: hypothetical protein BroJett018_39590 [Chloroflexota bacterium]